jgi:hypothetical protein
VLLARHPHLGGWLYRSTCFASAKLKRSEQRRQLREQEASAMNEAPSEFGDLNWDRLRPVLDEVLHELPERNRTAILLRYFEGKRFAEMGHQLGLSEDAARMRVERSLARLRQLLERRHITSTSSALAVLLANQPTVAVPTGLAASIGSAVLLVAPASPGLLSLLTMSKLTTPLIIGAAAAGLTLGLWTLLPGGVTPSDLEALREENSRLTDATAANARPRATTVVPLQDASPAVARQVEERRIARLAAATAADAAAGTMSTGDLRPQHRNHGLATPRDAMLTFAWACDAADVDALATMTWFDPEVREKAIATMATLPASLTAQYTTPEQFYGFINAAVCLQAPPPGADVIEKMLGQTNPQEVRPGRLVYPNRHELQHTPDGWKWVFPEVGVTRWLHVLGDNVLTGPPRS